MKLRARILSIAVSVAVALAGCNAATLNRIDPIAHPTQCPMMCPPTQSFPNGGCCELGDSQNDGYACQSPLDRSPNICVFQGITPPDQNDIPEMRKRTLPEPADAGAAPDEPPPVEHDGHG